MGVLSHDHSSDDGDQAQRANLIAGGAVPGLEYQEVFKRDYTVCEHGWGRVFR